MSATRLYRRQNASVLAVRRARLKVLRGPDRGLSLELSTVASALIGTDGDADLVLTDDAVSQRHAELRPTARGWLLRDLGSTNGTFVGDLRVNEVILDGKSRRLHLGETEIEVKLLDEETEHALEPSPLDGMIGDAPAMRSLFALIVQAGPTDSTVLLEGESGAGKEMVAQALHRLSPRADGPFIVVDCGALARGLAESELFGHERGAFTGADRARAGALEEASGGTLFLDEIGELPPELQVKLLRALEAREVRRLGSDKARSIDVRIIAATHRKLERAVAENQFRRDLYYRIAVVKLRVPALRDRPEDVLPLARHFVAQLKPGADPDEILTPQLSATLAAHQWPGNVRELRNVVERLLVAGELETDLRRRAAPLAYHDARQQAIDRFERDYAKAVVAYHGGVVSRAAEHAGISRQMLHRILRKHDLKED